MATALNRRRFLAGSAGAAATLTAGSVLGRAQSTDTTPDSADRDDLEAFVDDAIESELAETDASGAVASVVHDGSIALSSDRLPWAAVPISRADDLSVQAGLALGASVVALSGVLGWPLAAAVRRYRGSSQSNDGAPRQARLAAGCAGGLLLGFVVAVVVAFVLLSALDVPSLLQRPPRGFELLFVMPIAGAVATLVAVGYVVQAWLEGFWSLTVRVHYTAVVSALVVLLWLFRYWNLFWP